MQTYLCILCFCLSAVILCLFKKFMSGPSYDTSRHNMVNKYAVITGGNSGIGRQTVLELVRLNCNVIIGARDKKKSEQVVKEALWILKLNKQTPATVVQHYYLDLGSKRSILQFSNLVNQRFPKVDYLVNNAGLSMISDRRVTEDGFQMLYGVNHLGHFYLTSLLMDNLKKSQFFRIINVSSMAHKRLMGFLHKFAIQWDNLNFIRQDSYQHKLSYSRSKLYNILFTKCLAGKIPQQRGLTASLHPGVVRTDIGRHQLLSELVKTIIFALLWPFTKSQRQGAQTILYTILDQKIESGQYYSDCHIASVSQTALLQENAQKLWEASQKDLGVKFQIKF